MRTFWLFANQAESNSSNSTQTPHFITNALDNSFFNVTALSSVSLCKLLAIFTLFCCISVVIVFYLIFNVFNISLVFTQSTVTTSMLFGLEALIIFCCILAFSFGFSQLQKLQPPCINTLNNQLTDSTNKQMLELATTNLRQQVSLDLHDSTIQPYIGLKLGLEALRRKLNNDDAIAIEVDELVDMTSESIKHLRHYITDLKPHLDKPLLAAIDTEVKKYQHHYGIEIKVKADIKLKINEALAAEIFQIVCEGLSNIRRHTIAKQAAIHLYMQTGKLVVEIINQTQIKLGSAAFKPRSIVERVIRLGGSVSINTVNNDALSLNGAKEASIVVSALIPLHATGCQYASN